MRRGVGKRALHVRIDSFENRQNFQADPVARGVRQEIRLIRAICLLLFGKVRKDLRLVGKQQRTDQTSRTRPHAGKTVGAASAQKMQKKRFRLIIPMMSDRYAVEVPIRSDAFQKRVARVPCGKLERNAGFPRDLRHVDPLRNKRNAQPIAQRTDKRRILVRFVFADRMMQMRRLYAPDTAVSLKL